MLKLPGFFCKQRIRHRKEVVSQILRHLMCAYLAELEMGLIKWVSLPKLGLGADGEGCSVALDLGVKRKADNMLTQ